MANYFHNVVEGIVVSINLSCLIFVGLEKERLVVLNEK